MTATRASTTRRRESTWKICAKYGRPARTRKPASPVSNQARQDAETRADAAETQRDDALSENEQLRAEIARLLAEIDRGQS